MSPEETMMLALTTGAASRMRPNNLSLKRREVLAYLDLVERLERAHAGFDWRMMEIAPGSKERQQALSEQIRQSGAAKDRALVRKSRDVLREVMHRAPEAVVAAFLDVAEVAKATLNQE